MVSGNYRDFLEELFAGLGVLEFRPMFGVGGLFCDGTMFAVIADERVFLKTDEASRNDYRRENAAAFIYRARDGSEIVTSYYELPARVFDDPGEAIVWARRAYEVALLSPASQRRQRKHAKPKPPRQPRRRLS